MLTTIVKLYNWIWKNEYAPKRRRERVVVNIFKKETRLARGSTEG